MSENRTVVQSLIEVMKDVGAVKKGDRNQAQGFNFRGIDAVVNAVSPALQKHGIIVVPSVEDYEYTTITIGKNRTEMGHVKVKVSYTFIGSAGDTITTKVVAEAMDAGDKATAKAMSVAFRTALLQSLSLPTDEPDPDASSYERAPKLAIDDVVTKISQAVSVDELAEVGAFITANAGNIADRDKDELRSLFRQAQTELSRVKDEIKAEDVEPVTVS